MENLQSTERSVMSSRQFWIVTVASGLVLVLALLNLGLAQGNRERQADLAARGQFLQQTAGLEPIYRDLLRGVAELGARNNDADLRKLAESQGITFNTGPQAKGK